MIQDLLLVKICFLWKKKIFVEEENVFLAEEDILLVHDEDILLVQYMEHENKKYVLYYIYMKTGNEKIDW